MGNHKYYGVVNEIIERPDPKLIDGFRRHDVAKVGDAMGGYGIMNYELKPILLGMKLLGTAVTVITRPGDALFIQKVADIAGEGDVVVVDAGGFKDSAIIGERIGTYMKEIRKIAGIVVDGAVRDSMGLIEIGFPTFARAITPRIYGTQGPGAINVPISCGGVTVNPGDLIMADNDGIVVVPKDDIERVLKLTDQHLEGELERAARVNSGEKISVVNHCDEKIARWR